MILYDRFGCRKTAPFHVQIELSEHQIPLGLPSPVEIRGVVVRLFRADGRLALGDQVAFDLWICLPGEEPTGPPFAYRDQVLRATHVEAYLSGEPPKLELAGYEFTFLQAATDTAEMSIAQLEIAIAEARFDSTAPADIVGPRTPSPKKKWWQFWKREDRQVHELDWLMKSNEPFFTDQSDAESYVMRELSAAVPGGWKVIQSQSRRLSWIITNKVSKPVEWPNQSYSLRISRGLDFLILTYGNNDIGVFALHHALQTALVMDTAMLRRFSLRECLDALFADRKPDEFGYT